MHAYVTVDEAKRRLQITSTDANTALGRIVVATSRSIDRHCRRTFQPETRTRVLAVDWPAWSPVPDLLSVSSATASDGSVLTDSDYTLVEGDEYDAAAIAITLDAAFYWVGADGLTITGRWGYSESLQPVGTLGAAVATPTARTITLANGHGVEAGHTLRIGSEDLYVVSVATNTATVRRGQNGTTATTHDNATAVDAYEYPFDVTEAAMLLTARLWRRADAPFGVTGSAEVGQQMVISRMDPDVTTLLQPYRRIVVGGTAVR